MRRLSFFLILILFSCTSLVAQRYHLPDSTGVFGLRVAELMAETGNAYLKNIGTSFNTVWDAGFSEAQKKNVVTFARQMQKDGAPVYPIFSNYFSMLSSAVSDFSLSSEKIDNLQQMVELSYKNYDGRTFAAGLASLKNIFKHHAIFYSKNNKLYFTGNDIDFEFRELADDYAPLTIEDELLNELSNNENGGWGSDSTNDNTNDGWGDSTDDGWTDDGWGDSSSDDGWSDNNTDDGWNDSAGSENSGWGAPEEQEPVKEEVSSAMEAVAAVYIPDAQGAVVKFGNTNLTFVTRYDSTTIQNTQGDYEIHQFAFVGNGGKFGWGLAGFDENQVYTEFGKYRFDTRLPELKVEKAYQYYQPVVAEKMEGIFEYKSVKRDSLGHGAYPMFMSYHSNVEYQLGYQDFYFRGGFTLTGRKVSSNSFDGADALVEVNSGKGPFFRGKGRQFHFEDSVVVGRNTALSIYHGKDSITHPSMKMLYYPGSKRLTAIKEDNGFDLRPFNISYHKMTIAADMIEWDMNSDSLNISILNAKGILPAVFESRAYFNRERLSEMTGVFSFNPVVVAFSYGSKNKSREFYAADLAKDFNLNENAVLAAMKMLWYRGFINYDPDLQKVYIKDKLIHYVRSQRKRIDYDELLINSLATHKPNATLNLENNEMTVRGIDKFYISETQDIYIMPLDSSITLLKDRDFSFKGQLFAGNFEFGGRNFTFRYDSFLVDLENIDSIKFKVEGKDFRKREVDNKLVSVDLFSTGEGETKNTNTSGVLYINKPDNKSGNMIYPEYPIFDAERGAVVYFDQEDILDGAYDKSLYFYIPPFGIDSLSAEDPAAIGFEGTFFSDGMLPEFNETLRIQPDYSLGFTHNIFPEGYDLYGTGGRMYGKLKLDKNGLVGAGKIEYLSSSSQSEAYAFYLDSMTAQGTNYVIESGTINGASFPDIATPTYRMNWKTTEDKMYVYNQDEPFDLYNNTASLEGATILGKKGVNGEGIFKARGFEAKSKEFTFRETEMMARHSNFVVASENPDKPLMQGNDIRLDFDLNANIGELSPEVEGVAALEFPYSQMKTSISKATWNLADQKVIMEKPENVDIRSSYFYSTRKELDSLAFNATGAEYDLQTSKLLVTGIPYIKVADALITPENNEVLVFENSTIGTLTNTDIVIDTLYGYHHMFDGTINIISRKKFTGNATYRLVNAVKDTFAIKFGKFELREVPEALSKDLRGLQTVSGGKISEGDNLAISPGMLFKGDVTMYAQQLPLKLDGYVKLDFQNVAGYDTWIKYASQDEEAQQVVFDFNTSVTENGKSLNAGLHYGEMSHQLYGTFVQERKNVSDNDFFRPSGQLWYDEARKVFIIMDSLKADGKSYAGNHLIFNELTSEVEFEGTLNFINPGESMKIRASGRGQGKLNEEKFEVNTFAIVDYDLPDDALMEMFTHIFETVDLLGAPEAESDKDALIYKMASLIGDKPAVEWDQMSLQEYLPVVAASNQLIGDVVFSKINLAWNKDLHAWYSQGRLGLSHILRNDINALTDGFVEIRKTEKGDVVNIYLQVSPDCWYFFNYEENKLIAYSNNDLFNEIIAGKSKIDKADFGEYVFVLGDKSDAMNFINRFRLDYLGIKEPYEMYVPKPAPVEQTLPFLQNEEQPKEGESVTQEEILQQQEQQETQPVDDTEGF